MIKGILYALGACIFWGLIFVIPQFMTGFSPLEITLGRYFFFGAVSSLIFFKDFIKGRCRYPKHIWFKALPLSLASTFLYYIFLILALRYSSPPICALVLGISPVTIALYGNWKQKEIPYRQLIIPSILLTAGLVMVNVPHLETTAMPLIYCLGLFYLLISLSSWSWYVVVNSKFLKSHPKVSSSDWVTMVGVATLGWVLVLSIILIPFCSSQIDCNKFFTHSDELERFLIGAAILGLLCSWVGNFLWNKATLYLPVSLAGQLTIFETIFGVTYLFAINQSLPSPIEGIGMVLMLSAILYAIRKFTIKKKKTHDQIPPH